MKTLSHPKMDYYSLFMFSTMVYHDQSVQLILRSSVYYICGYYPMTLTMGLILHLDIALAAVVPIAGYYIHTWYSVKDNSNQN